MNSRGKSILVLSYVVSPYRGSEASVAWNYITEMSKEHHLTVLYGCGGLHLGDNDDMERWLAEKSMPNVDFVFVKPNSLSKILNWPNRKGFFPMCYHLAYRAWHRTVYKVARELVAERHFDLIHYLGSSGYSQQGYLWKLDLPYMRGPMGGFNIASDSMLSELPALQRLRWKFRNWHIRKDLKRNDFLAEAVRCTDVIIGATSENARVIKRHFGKDCDYMPENCMRNPGYICNDRFVAPGELNIMMAGRLDANKNNILLLQAISRMTHADKVHVDFVGDGPMRPALERYIADNKLGNIVTIRGMMPRDKVQELFDNAHLHVVTSVSEGNPTVVWEAMEHGVPTLTLDHCGMADVVDAKSGVKIPIGTSEEMSAAIAVALDALVETPERLKQLSEGTIERSTIYQWDERRRKFNQYYDQTIANYNNRLKTHPHC